MKIVKMMEKLNIQMIYYKVKKKQKLNLIIIIICIKYHLYLQKK